jgi:drug/metabolite transporter (DMT)-like permease
MIKGYAYLFLGMAIVGVYVALSKPLTQAFPVFLLATLRFAIAAILMLPWLASPNAVEITAGVKKTLFWQSFFGNFLFSICMLYGVSQTSATASGMILASLPAVVAVLSCVLLKEHLAPRTMLAVVLAFAGVAALSVVKDASGAMTSTGNVLVFCCVICEAIYIILGKRLTKTLSAKKISALINIIGLCLIAPFGCWQAISFDFSSVSLPTWGLLVFYAVAASILSTWAWLTGLKSVPANQSGVFTIALPIAAALVGIGFLGEQFTFVHGFAFVCAALGVLIMAKNA